MLEKYKYKSILMICPNEEKMKILDILKNDNNIYNIKFMTIEEFKNNYFFSYDEKTLYYLINKYNYQIDVCRVYLDNMYVVDINKTYNSSKLNFLKELKKELIDNKLLYFNNTFKEYLKDKTIIVKNYYNLEKYLEEIFENIIEPEEKYQVKEVIEYQTIEDEINGVCLKIIELLNNNIPIDKIYLTNIDNEYKYMIKKIFSYYNIPINIDMNNSIYSTKVVKDYLQNKKLDLDNIDNNIITKKLINVLNSLVFIDDKNDIYNKLLIDKLQKTKMSSLTIKNAINIKNIYNETFNDDEYIFVLGFNQDVLPKNIKDESYIEDKLKDEISLYKTNYINKRNKLITKKILNSIKNIYLSYKLETPFNSYYKSNLINQMNLKIVKESNDNYSYSNIYNEIRLGEQLDRYFLYNEEDKSLKKLITHYNTLYNTYSNKYTGINKDNYLKYLNEKLNLSYTKINTYNECNFKYYIKYVLKLDPYKDTFQSYIGSMYHDILLYYTNKNFDFEKEYQKYLEKRDLSLKEKVLLIRIKKELLEFIELIKKQKLLTGYDNELHEKKIEIELSNNEIETTFTGIIDKIMYYKKIEDTYFTIIDYKSGTIDTKIEPIKYGLHMQLPVYLYLIHYSKVFNNPIFTGIYYQNILFPYPNYDKKDINELKEDRIKLDGYSIDNPSILEVFDTTYEKSKLIKSMAYSEEKGFNRYSKIINDDTLFELVKYTKKTIEDNTKDIINNKFDINPKYYDKKLISCEYCSYKDLCFMKEKDINYLDKVEDLDFLGGDNNA